MITIISPAETHTCWQRAARATVSGSLHERVCIGASSCESFYVLSICLYVREFACTDAFVRQHTCTVFSVTVTGKREVLVSSVNPLKSSHMCCCNKGSIGFHTF